MSILVWSLLNWRWSRKENTRIGNLKGCNSQLFKIQIFLVIFFLECVICTCVTFILTRSCCGAVTSLSPVFFYLTIEHILKRLQKFIFRLNLDHTTGRRRCLWSSDQGDSKLFGFSSLWMTHGFEPITCGICRWWGVFLADFPFLLHLTIGTARNEWYSL